MYRLTFLKLIAVLQMKIVFPTMYPNHNYNVFSSLKRVMTANFDTIKNESMQKRQQELLQFSKEANDYLPDEVISYENIVGTIPSKFRSKINYTSQLKSPVLTNHISESQLHYVRVAPGHKVKGDVNITSTKGTTFYNRPPGKYSTTQHTASFIKPKVQLVKVHVFCGPNTKYIIHRKHKKQEKQYSHWGHIVSQPASNDHSKNRVYTYF